MTLESEIEYWIPKLRKMEERYLPELDHKDCGNISELLCDCLKSVRFVEHVQSHLDKLKEDGVVLEHYKVMCKICNKTIDEINEIKR